MKAGISSSASIRVICGQMPFLLPVGGWKRGGGAKKDIFAKRTQIQKTGSG
jgi:hypothetical protein